MQQTQYIASVKNAFRILRCFSLEEPEKRVSDIANMLGINKSTVSRTLATMANEGFVYKDPDTNKYRLGLSIVSLSGIVSSQLDVYRESQPVLNSLVDSIGETAHLAILDETDIMYLQKVECHHPVRVLTNVGKRNPAYCTSSGKVMLAFSPAEAVNKVLENGFVEYTKNTITDPDEFLDHLEQIRKSGYSVSTEEILEGVTSIAAPIFDYTGKVIAAISVVGPNQRIQPYKVPQLASKIMAAAEEISERMGYWKNVNLPGGKV